MNKTSLLIYHEWTKLFREMSDHDVKAIILALLDYDATGKEPPVDIESDIVKAIYQMMLEKTEKNRSLFIEKCEKNAKNGALGGRPKKDEKPKKADRIGLDRIGMDRIGEEVCVEGNKKEDTHTPSLAEVKKFCSDEGLSAIDADRFWNYYESRNWMIDGQPMDWQARARFWNSGDAEKKKTSFNNFHQRKYDFKALEEELLKK
jgi:hypothetical protein